jgi:hypothetical protein
VRSRRLDRIRGRFDDVPLVNQTIAPLRIRLPAPAFVEVQLAALSALVSRA